MTVKVNNQLESLSDQELQKRMTNHLIELSNKDPFREKKKVLAKEILAIHQIIVRRAMDESFRQGWAQSAAGPSWDGVR